MPTPKNGYWDSNKKFKIRILAQIIKKNIDTKKFCIICGNIIIRNGENSSQWNKKKKCSKHPKVVEGLQQKHCTSCGKIFYKKNEILKKTGDVAKRKFWASWGLCSSCKKKNLDKRTKIANFGGRLIDEFCFSIKTKKFPQKRKKYLPISLQKCIPEIKKTLIDFSKKLFYSEKKIKRRYPVYEEVCTGYKNYEEIWKKHEEEISILIYNQLIEFSDYEFVF